MNYKQFNIKNIFCALIICSLSSGLVHAQSANQQDLSGKVAPVTTGSLPAGEQAAAQVSGAASSDKSLQQETKIPGQRKNKAQKNKKQTPAKRINRCCSCPH